MSTGALVLLRCGAETPPSSWIHPKQRLLSLRLRSIFINWGCSCFCRAQEQLTHLEFSPLQPENTRASGRHDKGRFVYRRRISIEKVPNFHQRRQQKISAWRVNRNPGRVGIGIPALSLKASCHVDRSIGAFAMRSGDTPQFLDPS